MAELPTVSGQPSDAELWRGVEATVRNVLLPALSDEWARAAAVQLVGMARYAQRRPADPTTARAAEVAFLLDALLHNPLVAARWQSGRDASDAGAVFAAAGEVLAAAVNDDGPAGEEVRQVLRPLLVRQLDDELAVTGPLVAAFRGQLDE